MKKSETYSAVKLVITLTLKTLLLLGLNSSIHAATYWVNNEASLLDALNRAYVDRDQSDTIVVSGTIYLSKTINIQSKVTIKGADTQRQSTLKRYNWDFSAPMINVQYHGVTLHNLTLQGIGQNSNVQLAKYAKWDSSNSALINLPATHAGFNPNYFNIYDCNLIDSAIGISSVGIIPQNLNISYNSFNRVNRGIELLRDVYRAQWQLGDRLYAGKLNIAHNQFHGNNIRLGISIDAGNDGFPYVAPSFPDHYAQIRKDIKDKASYFEPGSNINYNKIYNAREFGIAMATVANLHVEGNYVSSYGNEGEFSAGINIEHNANNIVIKRNQIHVGTSGNFANAFTVLPYNDHGAPLNAAQASSNITFDNNTVTGIGRNVFFASGYKNLVISNTNANNFQSTDSWGINAVLHNVPGAQSNSSAWSNSNLKFAQWWVFSGTGSKAPQTYYYDNNGQLQSYAEAL
ncbi:hypothetical protein [Agaribacterium haliotis]|uniref:hypothetical protein n=1 Tax=Agaribacterium haliotis TaxID=2013869 RepID=UPI000BB58928|nr:hypothetical protein [Agaribacterium haliotis]